jgi:putative ABC transport system permease protein
MGKSNVPLISEATLFTWFESFSTFMFGAKDEINLIGWMVNTDDVVVLLAMLIVTVLFGILMFWFFKTDIGTSMRATGNNAQMIRALGVNTKMMIILGLAISNGMIALSGALLAQYQGFADVQMGLGMLVWGLASVIIGEALITKKTLGYIISGAIMGSILFRLLVAIALRWGMNPNDLKLITAVFVFIALILPGLIDKTRKTKLTMNIQS